MAMCWTRDLKWFGNRCRKPEIVTVYRVGRLAKERWSFEVRAFAQQSGPKASLLSPLFDVGIKENAGAITVECVQQRWSFPASCSEVRTPRSPRRGRICRLMNPNGGPCARGC